MSHTMSPQNNSGCAFCRSRKLPWSKHTVDNCAALAANVCEICNSKGHSVSRCPDRKQEKTRERREEIQILKEKERYARWVNNQKLREQETIKKAEEKAKSWAGIASKNLSPEITDKITQEDILFKKQYEEKERQKKLAAKQRWEQNYPYRMEKQYGLKANFYYDATDFDTIIARKGDYWYFIVEKTKDDHEIAKNLRENGENQKRFLMYLHEKYWDNWLEKSENTIDDCWLLGGLRADKREADFRREIAEEERAVQYERDYKESKREMKRKLQEGEITAEEYQEWKWACEDEDMSFIENASSEWCYKYEIMSTARKQWIARDSARKAAANA